jgi:HD-GYP domain-containing protein (c-di-GMP phosphodiesterase class II)
VQCAQSDDSLPLESRSLVASYSRYVLAERDSTWGRVGLSTTCDTTETRELRGLIAIPIVALRAVRRADADLYIFHESNAQPVLYQHAGTHLSGSQIEELEATGHRSLFVRPLEFEHVAAQLLASLGSVLEDDNIRPDDRFAVLQIAVAAELEHAVRLIHCDKFVKLSRDIGRHIRGLIGTRQLLPNDLFRIARHDYHTFTHVTNVASYAVMLAQETGISDAGDLERIAVAGMLHDLGKRFVPRSVLLKPSPLTPIERELVQTHPQRGYEMLLSRDDVDTDQLMAVYQHHEHMDGCGYPVGITGEEIHPWAQLIAVVDVFDALTGMRTYRRAATVQQACAGLLQHAGTHLNQGLVECWTSMLTDPT